MNRAKQNNAQRQRGFTLIELLIVIVILGLLASLVAPQMFSKVDSSRIQTAQTQIQMIETALKTYRIDTGKFPKNLEALRSSNDPMWDGPYLPKDVPNDPWGNPYIYEADGSDFTLKSYGPDGAEGGEGDNADITR